MTKLKTEVAELKEKMKAGMTVNSVDGTGTEDNLYLNNMPDGITPELDKAVDNYRSTFIAAGTLAFGEIAVGAMQENKDLANATTSIKVGEYNTLNISVDRSREFNNGPGSTEKIVKHGVVKASYEVQGAKSAGQLKVAMTQLAELATSTFTK